MRKTVFGFLLLLPLLIGAQENAVIYYGVNGAIDTDKKPVLKKEIRYRGKKRVRVRTFKENEGAWRLLFTERIIMETPETFTIRIKGESFSENVIRRFEEPVEGVIPFTDLSNEKIRRTGYTQTKIPLTFHGEITEFYSNGNKKSVSFYENNQMVSNRNWTEEGEKYIDDIFYSVDREPVFLRGMQLMHQHLLKIFVDSKLDLTQLAGRMVVGFVVMENGEIDGLRIEQGMGRELNNLAIKAFNSLAGHWQPALLNGEEVRYYQLFPINFISRQVDLDFLELRGSMLYWDIN